MKYVIDVPDNPIFVTACYLNDGIPKAFNLELEPYIESRKAIEDEVWRFCMNTDWSYQEAQTRYEEWKKQKDEIRVGDECVDEDGDKCVVTVSVDDDICDVIYDDGSTDEVHEKFLRKTGRHFDEVEELLKKMWEG